MIPAMEIEGTGASGPHPALLPRPDAHRELCQLVTDWQGSIAAGGQIVEPKLDGIRALWIDGELVTREGSPILGAEHIEAALMRLEYAAAQPMFFDGEWTVEPEDGNPLGTFAATLAHFQARGRASDKGTLWLFDAMPARVWRGEDPCETLEVRRGKLDRMLTFAASNEVEKISAPVRPMPWAWMDDVAEIERHARDFIAQGAEGIVVKHALSTYQRKRGAAWQRIKRAMTLDLEVVGAVPQKDRAWLLGALVLDYRGKRVRVSTGFSDAERMALWRDRADLPGLTAEVSCMEVTEAGSLRQARFVRMRGDRGGCYGPAS